MRSYIEYNPAKPKIFKDGNKWGVIYYCPGPLVQWVDSFNDAVKFAFQFVIAGGFK